MRLYLFCIKKVLGNDVSLSSNINAIGLWVHPASQTKTLIPVCRDNDTYRGSYRYNASTDTVTGNPASSARVQDMLQALKNKSRANGAGGRNHAEAMLIEDLRKLLDWSTSQCPNDWLDKEITDVDTLHFIAKHLMMRAFTTSGFVIWTRY